MSQNPGEGTKKPKHRFMKFAGILIFFKFSEHLHYYSSVFFRVPADEKQKSSEF